MTVHAVQIVCSTAQAENPSTVPTPEPPELVNVLPDRVQQNVFDTLTEVLPEQAQDAVVTNTEMDGSGTDYIRCSYRADGAHTKTEVLDEFENGVVIDADWYEVRYHECDHDEANPTGCPSWTTERTAGTVPSGV